MVLNLRLDVFSDPDTKCRGAQQIDKPCGVDRGEVDGADAVASLDAVRFQVQRGFRKATLIRTTTDSSIQWTTYRRTPRSGRIRTATVSGILPMSTTTTTASMMSSTRFPLDATETADSDDDGVGDNGDPFPDDPSEWADTDGDGVGDNGDPFPDDPFEWADTDGDGVGDNGDPFPDDPSEWADTDGDGVGDNTDPDADGDGFANEVDLFPTDPTRSDLSSYVFVAEATDDRLGESVLAVSTPSPYIVLGCAGL